MEKEDERVEERTVWVDLPVRDSQERCEPPWMCLRLSFSRKQKCISLLLNLVFTLMPGGVRTNNRGRIRGLKPIMCWESQDGRIHCTSALKILVTYSLRSNTYRHSSEWPWRN